MKCGRRRLYLDQLVASVIIGPSVHLDDLLLLQRMVHLKADLVTPRFLEHVLAAPFMRDIPVAELPQPGTRVAVLSA